MNRHSSYTAANFIDSCNYNVLKLLILPPYCLHISQPLDIGALPPLKHALVSETDTASRLDLDRLQRD